MTDSIDVKLRNKDATEDHLHRIGVTSHYVDWWKAFGSDDLRKVYENFGMELFRRSSCLDGFNAFVGREGFKGKRCIEIGTCNGLTAIVLSRHFDEVVTFDIEPRPVKHELAEFCGIKNICFNDIKDNDERDAIIRGLEFDAAYSDGNHTHDSQRDFDLVGGCGRVMFHECWPLQPQVWELVSGLRATGSVKIHGNYAIWQRTG